MLKFNELGLDEDILKAIEELGFETPTPVQQKAIPAMLNGTNDVVALAQTGTGKTAAFGLPILQLSENDSRNIQSLVLCPTRELCIQITKDVEKFSKYSKGFKVTAVYGGASINDQMRNLRSGCQMVVGTPGRVLDLINRGALKINHIQWLVLDEADEMLNMGFQEDLDSILSTTPEEKRTFLFSATMPAEISRIAKRYMHNPEEISVGGRNEGVKTISHEYYMVQARNRYEVLKRIADINPNIYSIVFCRTRRETKEVAEKLMADGYNADALYGDLSQAQRDYVMGRFRSKQLQMLVATDVAARGIDVTDITHVINYDLPDELEVYIHRSGRTGRAGKSGISISILHSRENRKLKDLERMVGAKFEKKPVPTGSDICETQLMTLIDKVQQLEIDEKQIDKFMPAITERLADMSRDELLKRFISIEFNRFLAYYKNARDLNNDEAYERSDRSPRDRERGERTDRGERGERSERGPRGNVKYTRFFINLGTKDSINAARLMGIINEKTGSRDMQIGRIDVMNKFTFFEIDSQHDAKVLSSFAKADFDGIPLVVEITKKTKEGVLKEEGGSGRDKPSFSRERTPSTPGFRERTPGFRERAPGGFRERRKRNR
jgi:ATP-dependent RNA helicase DeaD